MTAYDTPAAPLPPTVEKTDDDRWLSVCLLIAAAVLVGMATNVNEGLYQKYGIRFLVLGLIAALLAAVNLPIRSNTWLRTRLPVGLLAVGIVLQFIQLYSGPPGTIWNAKHLEHGIDVAPWSRPGKLFDWQVQRHIHDDLFDSQNALKDETDPKRGWELQRRILEIESTFRGIRFQMALLVLAAITLWAGQQSKMARKWAFPLLLAAHFALGVYIIKKNPTPFIDVHVFQQEACKALLEGRNPYDQKMRMLNIYGADSFVYAAELQEGEKLKFGYPYPPLSLYLSLPGYLAKDYRYSHLAAVTIAAALIATCGKGLIPRLAAILFLFTPRLFTVIEVGWTEPLVVMLLAFTVWCAARSSRWLPVALGLFLASKQYTVFIPVIAVLLVGRPFSWRKYLMLLGGALVIALIVSLPLALWDWKGFWHSAVSLQLKQPFRKDALSLLGRWYWWKAESGSPPDATMAKLWWVGFAAVIPAMALVIWRCPRSAFGFAMGVAVVYLCFLAGNKQAFCNYYFFVIGAMCCAIAAYRSHTDIPVITSPAPDSAGIPLAEERP